MYTINLIDEAETIKFAKKLADMLAPPLNIALMGQLGMGKTTLIRAILRSTGITENVKSPSFSIMESYHSRNTTWIHMDCYRLAEVEELEIMGFRDLLEANTILMVEWPEKLLASGFKFDLVLVLERLGAGRKLTLDAWQDKAANIISMFKDENEP